MRIKPWLSIGAVIIAATVVSPLGKSYADTLSHEKLLMNQLLTQATQTNESIIVLHAKTESLTAQIQNEQQSLDAVQTALSNNAQQADIALTQLHTLTGHIVHTEKQISVTKQNLRAQLRTMYENGKQSYLSVLFSATSWSDFLSRVDMLIMIAKADNQMEQQFVTLRTGLVLQKRNADTVYTELQKKHSEYALLQRADMAVKQEQQQALADASANIAATTARHGMLESQIQLTQSQIQKIEAETAQAQALMNNTSYVEQQRKNLVTVDSSALIKYAETFMGIPYVWGGTSPSGFDCSGFTQYVYNHFGVSIYRTSEEQFAEGIPINSSNLQPGDLVFFSTYAPGATHVGIYVGNGMMVDSQDFGVSIDNIFNSYWGPKYLGARQIIKL